MKRAPWIVAFALVAAVIVLVAHADAAPKVRDVGPTTIVLTPAQIEMSPLDQLPPETWAVVTAFDTDKVTGFYYDDAARTLTVSTPLVTADASIEWRSDCYVNNTQFTAPNDILAANDAARELLKEPLIALARLRYGQYAHFKDGTADFKVHLEQNKIEILLYAKS